jgi:hypothetical protein
MKKSFLLLSLLLVCLSTTTKVQAQEENDESSDGVSAIEELESSLGPSTSRPAEGRSRSDYGSPGFFGGARWVLDMGADSFERESFRQTGTAYGLGLSMKRAGKYELGAGGSYLVGESRGVEVKELGNPFVKANIGVLSFSRFELWLQAQATISRPGAKLAARHDTYRMGLEFQYNPLRYESRLGAGYRLRKNEEDSTVDIRDITDAEMMVGRRFFRKLTLYGHGMWYRASGVEKNRIEIAKPAEWIGAGPGMKFQVSPQFFLKSQVTYAVSRTRSVEETEFAVWDSTLPSGNDPTWQTDVGVQF